MICGLPEYGAGAVEEPAQQGRFQWALGEEETAITRLQSASPQTQCIVQK